jgi:phosphoribosyl 1,2-cyclic phosphodiesterase
MPPKPPTVFVTFWGTRGSISTPGSSTEKYGGNTPCVSYRFEDTDIVLDAGTGIRNLGLELEDRGEKLDIHLLLSHTHWDHIQGLPFFQPAYMPNTKISIYGSASKGNFLEGILSRQMDVNYFPVDMNAFKADISITEISTKKLVIDSVTIDWQEQLSHPGGSVRYRMQAGGKKVVYATDVELDMFFGPGRRTKEQRRLSDLYCEFIKDCDLLIADGQYIKSEYEKHAGWGHSTISTLLKVAQKQRVKQLAVFHHDPQHSDTMLDAIWSKYAPKYSKTKPPMNVFWAREGMTLAI